MTRSGAPRLTAGLRPPSPLSAAQHPPTLHHHHHHHTLLTNYLTLRLSTSRYYSTLLHSQHQQSAPVDLMTTDIQNLKSFDPFAEADDAGGEVKGTQQNYIHIRIQRKYPAPSVYCCATPAQQFISHISHPLPRNRARLTSTPQSVMVARP